ncbi:MAG: helix-turn-helix transcriptional regulator [Actinobacteria bacterium]|nr:helix-turn-helix transcriptional regulator [Actinomycetota bacterium]
MNLRTIVESMHGGSAALASARLRRNVLRALDEGMEASGISQAELARRLGRSRSAVSQVLTGDGNLRVERLAEYLEAMGCELVVSVGVADGPSTSAPIQREPSEHSAARPRSG